MKTRMSSAWYFSDNILDDYEQLILMIKSLNFIVQKYPIGNYLSKNIGNIELTYSVNPVAYCRAVWAKKYKTPFRGTLDQTNTLRDTYLSFNVNYNVDPLVVKLLTYYKISS